MNFINKTLCITALFAIGSVAAKPIARRGTVPAATTPAAGQNQAPAQNRAPAQQPAAQVQSYKQLHDNILRMSQASVFAGNKFQPTFIQNTIAQAQTADIGADGLRFLLQTARDKFAPFMGNNDSDLNLLMQINGQIDNAVGSI
jgi:hypothetical protein